MEIQKRRLRSLSSWRMVAPKDVYVLFYYADLAWEMGRFDEAESALEKCLATSPLDALCNFDTMMLRVSQNRFDEALHNYESLTKRSVDYPWFDVPAGLALLGKDDVDGAEKKLTHFAEASKRFHGSVHFTTAQEYRMDLLTYQGRIAEARALGQELGAMEKPEERPNPLLDMAMTDAVLGYTEHAKADLKLAQGMSSGNSDSKRSQTILAIVRANRNSTPSARPSSGRRQQPWLGWPSGSSSP